MRAVRGLPSLRGFALARAIGWAFHGAKGRGRRVTQFSIQQNHLHLIVEADDRVALMRDVRAVAIAIAKRVNRALGRLGRVFDERYHARALSDPRSVRTALVYVLMNHRKHGVSDEPIDPMSSARWFDGWRAPPPAPSAPAPVTTARTELGRTAWRRLGLIGPLDEPRGAKPTREDYLEMQRFFVPLY